MADRPPIKSGEWIKVAHQNCLVTEAAGDDGDGQCEVIFDPEKPRHGKASWNGEEWVMPQNGGGGYAEKQPHLGMFVRRLKKGPSDQ